MLRLQWFAIALFLATKSFAEECSHWAVFISVVFVVVDVDVHAPLVQCIRPHNQYDAKATTRVGFAAFLLAV